MTSHSCQDLPTAVTRSSRPSLLCPIGVVVWATVVTVGGGCSHLPRRGPVAQDVIIARQLSQQGLDALHKGSLGKAEERFTQAIERCPTNTTARYQLANCLWKRGARQEAIEQLVKAIEMCGSEDVEMMVELGYMWANVGHLDQALEVSGTIDSSDAGLCSSLATARRRFTTARGLVGGACQLSSVSNVRPPQLGSSTLGGRGVLCAGATGASIGYVKSLGGRSVAGSPARADVGAEVARVPTVRTKRRGGRGVGGCAA